MNRAPHAEGSIPREIRIFFYKNLLAADVQDAVFLVDLRREAKAIIHLQNRLSVTISAQITTKT